MADRPDDWGTQNRGFLARHPWAGKLIATGTLLVGGAIGARLYGPRLLQSTEKFLRREFSASVTEVTGASRRGWLNPLAGALRIPLDKAGQVALPTTELGRFLRFAHEETQSFNGGLSHFQYQAQLAGGIQHMAGTLGLTEAALQEHTGQPIVRSIKSLLDERQSLFMTPGWMQYDRFRPIAAAAVTQGLTEEQVLAAAHGWTTRFEEIKAATPALQDQSGFIDFLKKRAGGVTSRSSWLGHALGLRNLELPKDTATAVAMLQNLDPSTGAFGEIAAKALGPGQAVDPFIFHYGEQDPLDLRLTGHTLRTIGRAFASKFQIPVIPGLSAFRPFAGALMESSALRPLEALASGSYQPAFGGTLTQGAYVSPQGAWTIGQTGEIALLRQGPFERALPFSKDSRLYGKVLGLEETRDQPLKGNLGWLADRLDIFRQPNAGWPEKILGKVARTRDPQWAGNLVKRIWEDPLDAAYSDAKAKAGALGSTFRRLANIPVGSSFAGAIDQYYSGLAGEAISLEESQGLATAYDVVSGRKESLRSAGLKRLLHTSYSDIVAGGQTGKLTTALRQEAILRDLGTGLQGEQIFKALAGQSPAGSLIAQGLGSAEKGERAFVLDALLRNLGAEDANALGVTPQELLLRMRAGPTAVRTELEGGAWEDAYGWRSPYIVEQDSAFAGNAFTVIPKTPLRSETRNALATIADRIRGAAREVSGKEVTTRSLWFADSLDKFNNRLVNVGLGLSSLSTGTPLRYLTSFATKRALPLAAGLFYADYLSWESRRLLRGGKADDEGRAVGLGTAAKANFGLMGAWLSEYTGFNALQKVLLRFIPGSEHYLSPRSPSELKDYYATGYEPVRRGAGGILDPYFRLRLVGRDPVYGSKIRYWRPNWYQRSVSDSAYSDSSLTRKEYYAHSWLPTPRSPFAPLNRLLNMYHWERKHSEDRPYPVSGDPFTATRETERSIAGLANSAIGLLLKPRRTLTHAAIRSTGTAQAEAIHAAAQYGTGGTGYTGVPAGTDTGGQERAAPSGPAEDTQDGALLRSTAGGTTSLYQVRAHTRGLLTQHAEAIHGAAAVERLGPFANYRTPRPDTLLTQAQERALYQSDVPGRLGEAASSLKRIMGIRGLELGGLFETMGFHKNAPAYALAPSHLGYGGARQSDVNYFNDTPNNLPSWLPGDYRGQDFHRGDPMGSMPEGTTRLPGAGYEKLYKVRLGEDRDATMDQLGSSQQQLASWMLGRWTPERPLSKAEDNVQRRQQLRDTFNTHQSRKGRSVDIRLPWFSNGKFGLTGPWLHLAGPATPSSLDVPIGGSWMHLLGEKYPFRHYFSPKNELKKHFALDIQTGLYGSPWVHLLGPKYPGRRYLNTPSDVVDTYASKSNAAVSRAGRKVFGKTLWHWQKAMMPDGYFPGWDEAIGNTQGLIRSELLDRLGLNIKDRPWLRGADRGDTASGITLYDPVHRIKGHADLLVEETKRNGWWIFSHVKRSLIPVLLRNNPGSLTDEDGQAIEETDGVSLRRDQAAAQFAAYMSNAPYAYLSYPNAGGQRLEKVKANKEAMAELFRTMNDARADAGRTIRESGVPKGEWYSAMDRFRILSDLAPGSDEQDYYEKKLSKTLDPDSSDWEEFQAIKARSSQAKDQYDLHPYRFARKNEVRRRRVTIGKLIDPNTFTTEEDPEHPIKFAGVRLSAGKMSGPEKDGTPGWVKDLASLGIRPGARVTVLSDPDTAMDMQSTRHSVVFTRGRNVNREVMRRGWARRDEHKSSPAELFVYHSAVGRTVGRFTEWLAHLDTPLASKFLKVRSPLEEYWRSELYGKGPSRLNHPWRDWVAPTIQSILAHNPLYAAVLGGAAAGLFVRGERATRVAANLGERLLQLLGGRTKATVMGIAAGATLLASSAIALSHNRDHPWIPRRRRKQWALQDYMDKLTYLKNMRQSLYYSNLAAKEGVNTQKIMQQIKVTAAARKNSLKRLGATKAALKRELGYGRRKTAAVDRAVMKAKLADINKQIRGLEDKETIQGVTPNAAKAIAYRKAAERTMTGMPSDAPVGDRLSALPTAHRQIVSEAMATSSRRDKAKLARLLPESEQRVIGRQLDPSMTTRKDDDLVSYFEKRFLPRPGWRGWDEDQSLSPVAAKEIDRLGMDPSDAGMSHATMQAGIQHPLSTGAYDQPRRADPAAVRAELHRVLAPHLDGLSVLVDASPSHRHQGNVNVHLTHDRSDDLDQYLNLHQTAAYQ